MIRTQNALVIHLSLLLFTQLAIADNEMAHSPRTNAERRQEGVRHDITSWLSATTLVDLEWQLDEFSIRDHNNDTIRADSANLQLGLSATPWEHIQAELNLEYDTATKQSIVDEAFVAFEKGDWELTAGKLYTPLGQYISHFPSGPLLEFGETRSHGIELSFSPDDLFDFSLTAYRGQAREMGRHSSTTDWAAAVTTTINDSYVFGLSYQSDLADANSALLADSDNRYRYKVAAASGFFIWMTEDFKLSFEVLGALDSFRELESDRNRPLAWNLEFVDFINPQLELALRAEGSRELEGEPEWQLGAALTWHINQDVSCSVEYLHGRFSNGLATNQANESYRHVDRLGLKVSIGF